MGVKAYYHASLADFCTDDDQSILGKLAGENNFNLEREQFRAWEEQLKVLKAALSTFVGDIFLECFVPRMGKRADAVILMHGLVIVVEFKVGAVEHALDAIVQVHDYALDFKNFHEGSHDAFIVPLLVSTHASPLKTVGKLKFADDRVAEPVVTNAKKLGSQLRAIVNSQCFAPLDADIWRKAGYKPTPTIVEAARALYESHNVFDISRSYAEAENLSATSSAVSQAVDEARRFHKKTICFITGVPGSGKTLAGLNIATQRSDHLAKDHAVFLSGNGPLVNVLRSALARDKAKSQKKNAKKDAAREVSTFIQNIHHFRDEYVKDDKAPVEKVVVFDEAQRAWSLAQASAFMQRKRGQSDFKMSEPEFLISVMNRHKDWCVIVCLIGGGQEINTGEAGFPEWVGALEKSFPDWVVHVSPRVAQPVYSAGCDIKAFLQSPRVRQNENLHLAVSMRSFRAEALSDFIGHIVDNEPEAAREKYKQIQCSYPIYITRDLDLARDWLRKHGRGSQRYGLVSSSGAYRLRPLGIHIKAKVDPVHWFLSNKNDVRSSFYLEDVATEFDVQGLELDWAGVCWDANFCHDGKKWVGRSFKGSKWQAVKDPRRHLYLTNAYRVILTRARQGIVIFVPKGDENDHTRPPEYYDGTFQFLRQCGLQLLGESET
jgi:hypothetical protein